MWAGWNVPVCLVRPLQGAERAEEQAQGRIASKRVYVLEPVPNHKYCMPILRRLSEAGRSPLKSDAALATS